MFEYLGTIFKGIPLVANFYHKVDKIGKPETALLNEIAENELVDSQLKDVAIRQLNKEYFYKLTKLYIEDPNKRYLLMKLSEESDNKLPLFYLKRAYKFLRFEGSHINILLTEKEEIANKKQKVVAISLGILSFLFIFAFFFTQHDVKYLIGGVCGLILVFSLYLEIENFWFAKEVEKYFLQKDSQQK